MTAINGKVVFITGASAGIGEACAEYFARAGAKLILSARRLPELGRVAARLTEKFAADVSVLEMDVRNRNQIEQALASLPCRGQNVDILVNNAGLALGFDKIAESQPEDWDAMLDTNIKGVLNVTKKLLPFLEKNNGHIINIGSVAGIYPYVNGAVYCASKAAVKFISDAIRMEMVHTQLRVTNIQPGMVETDFSRTRFKGDAERAKAVYSGIKPLSASDIADIVLYAASRPPHVQICEVTVTALHQAPVGAVFRDVAK